MLKSILNTQKIIISAALVLTAACSNSKFSGGQSLDQPLNSTQGETPVVIPSTPTVQTPPIIQVPPNTEVPMPTTQNPPVVETPPSQPVIPTEPVPPTQSEQPTAPVVVNPPTEPAPVTPPSQCVPVSEISQLTKILFLVDTSGSNRGFFGLGGTDSHKKFRLGSIQNFFSRYQGKTNFEWGFMTFSGHSASDFVGHDGENSFATNPLLMQKALNHFSQVRDSGNTPYKAALNHALRAIEKDPDVHSAKNPQYFVILLSDGFPTDIDEPEEIKNNIQKLLDTSPHNVSLSTVFYGHKHEWDADEAIELLTSMAQMGNGQFANATDPKSTINIDYLIPQPAVCPK